MRFKILFPLIALLLSFFSLEGQTPFPNQGKVFNDDQVKKIYIEIDPADLNTLYATLENEDHFPVTFIFDDGEELDTLENVGFRLRGNTSLFSAKKSFKIAFNAFEPGRKYKGLEKMNINGEHNDPSIIRSKLYWDLARQFGISASRSNHVELYINNEYWGIYIHVEHIDEEFTQLRFSQEIGNLYKCTWPSTLEYLGSNPDLYKFENNGLRAYELKTNTAEDDYSDLAHFIDILNNTPNDELPCELEKVFEVHNYLKVIALDILTAHWDGPIFNKNNFYLYFNPNTEKFQFIPYDVDNTFGVQWFGEWTNRNIYSWSPGGGEPRPIYDKIMANQHYKKQFTYYMEQLLDQYYTTDTFFDRIDELKTVIEPSVPNDPFYPDDYGFTIDDFNNSYTEGLSVNHIPVGIKEFITGRRASALNQLESSNTAPIITEVKSQGISASQSMSFSAKVEDEALSDVQLNYSFNGEDFTKEMFDDGLHNDGEANDQIFGTFIPPQGSAGDLSYYISATDMQSNENRFPYCESNIVELENTTLGITINEFQAKNESTIVDNNDEYDDWIELYNAGNNVINLSNYHLSDDMGNPTKWALPNIDLAPDQYILVWADNDTDQGELHANFKLSSDGEVLILSDIDGNILEAITFGPQIETETTGRYPNGIGAMLAMEPTPNSVNVATVNTIEPNIGVVVFPNPFNEEIYIKSEENIRNVMILDYLGRVVLEESINNSEATLVIDTSSGLYFMVVEYENDKTTVQRILKQ